MNDGGLAVEVEGLLRELAPRVLGALVRRHGRFDECEDAVQEALLAAALQWPVEGVPESPSGWLITVATRRLVDQARSESARRRREEELAEPEAPADAAPDHDDTLTLLFLCCHPDLSPPSQLALTLRAVGGLTTAEIASAFLVPEATMAQRISRAKQRVKDKTFSVELERARRRAARPLPDLQRGLHGQLGAGAGARRAHPRGDPAHPPRAPAAARRPRGRRAARADAAHRRPASGAQRPRRAHPPGRAGPLALGRGLDPRGRRADRSDAPCRPRRPVPAPGRDRRHPRRGRRAPRTPTGPRSSRSTTSSTASPRTRW